MIFRQIYEEGLAQASYLIGCAAAKEAIVVDPARDIDVYVTEAQKNGLRIVAVAETHIHADYLSGARELAAAVGATLYLSGEGGDAWQYSGLDDLNHVLVKDGDEVKVGNVRVQILHTPGHTPEHISLLIIDGAVSDTPMIALTGDFVFVGDVGRPDLLEEAAGIQGTSEPGARSMWRSLKEKFLSLPDHVQVWPGHGAGSACGKALGAIPSSTVGYERQFSWWGRYMVKNDEEGFVRTLLTGQPEAPTYFGRMKRLNRDGMPLLGGIKFPRHLTPQEFRSQVDAGAVLVDTRDKRAFAAGHRQGSLNIPAGKKLSTWAGWFLSYDRPIVLLTSPHLLDEQIRQLIRIGLDNVAGYIASLEGYATSRETATVPQISAFEARLQWELGEVAVLDVRAAEEYRSCHISGALNVHAGRVLHSLDSIPQDKPVVVQCQSGDRSSITMSALLAAGVSNVMNLTGGIQAWCDNAYPVVSDREPN